MTIEEIEKLLDYDLPEGDETTEKLIGLVDNPVETNAVKLKKASYKKS